MSAGESLRRMPTSADTYLRTVVPVVLLGIESAIPVRSLEEKRLPATAGAASSPVSELTIVHDRVQPHSSPARQTAPSHPSQRAGRDKASRRISPFFALAAF
jgi:hypothetical protein